MCKYAIFCSPEAFYRFTRLLKFDISTSVSVHSVINLATNHRVGVSRGSVGAGGQAGSVLGAQVQAGGGWGGDGPL